MLSNTINIWPIKIRILVIRNILEICVVWGGEIGDYTFNHLQFPLVPTKNLSVYRLSGTTIEVSDFDGATHLMNTFLFNMGSGYVDVLFSAILDKNDTVTNPDNLGINMNTLKLGNITTSIQCLSSTPVYNSQLYAKGYMPYVEPAIGTRVQYGGNLGYPYRIQLLT